MREIGTIAIKNVNSLLSIVKFDTYDYPLVKEFVIDTCKQLDDKSHFITDDIDSELPLLFKEGQGLVYGITHNNEIIATQAIDFGENMTLTFSDRISGYLPSKVMEVGWAMVSPKYRGNGFTVCLANRLELDAYRETGNEVCAVTVHPKNIASLFVYFKLGYIGIELKQHYNVIRMLLVKNLRSRITISDTIKSITVECGDYHRQEQLLSDGYVCFSVFVNHGQAFLKFIETDISNLLHSTIIT